MGFSLNVNPSGSAYADPPPFAQGRLWGCAKTVQWTNVSPSVSFADSSLVRGSQESYLVVLMENRVIWQAAFSQRESQVKASRHF